MKVAGFVISAAIVVMIALPIVVNAEVTPFEIQGFEVTESVTIPGTPEQGFDTMTGDIKPWWDHSVSENPAELRIDSFAGGQFYEVMPDDRGTVQHAVVIYAERGVGLRLHGPFGLSGQAIDMVTNITYAATGADSTTVSVKVNVVGQVDQNLAGILNNVWTHFLHGRLKPYVEGTLDN
jgi:hypothetical protein